MQYLQRLLSWCHRMSWCSYSNIDTHSVVLPRSDAALSTLNISIFVMFKGERGGMALPRKWHTCCRNHRMFEIWQTLTRQRWNRQLRVLLGNAAWSRTLHKCYRVPIPLPRRCVWSGLSSRRCFPSTTTLPCTNAVVRGKGNTLPLHQGSARKCHAPILHKHGLSDCNGLCPLSDLPKDQHWSSPACHWINEGLPECWKEYLIGRGADNKAIKGVLWKLTNYFGASVLQF